MDDIVKQAMVKWPKVPAAYGWLALDRRGRWRIKGERISNPAIAEFINRNYAQDPQGCWYFQNGPQRVFVALEYTPFVYHLAWSADPGAPSRIVSHTGRTAMRADCAWIDEQGIVLLQTEHGIGMVDDRDLDRLLPCFTGDRGAMLSEDAIAAAIERLQGGGDASLCFQYRDHSVRVSPIAGSQVPVRLGFVQHPSPPPGHEVC